jgi:hypothetical protein
MQVHLIDGTYELYRSFFGAPKARGRPLPADAFLPGDANTRTLRQNAPFFAYPLSFLSAATVQPFPRDAQRGVLGNRGADGQLWIQAAVIPPVSHGRQGQSVGRSAGGGSGCTDRLM